MRVDSDFLAKDYTFISEAVRETAVPILLHEFHQNGAKLIDTLCNIGLMRGVAGSTYELYAFEEILNGGTFNCYHIDPQTRKVNPYEKKSVTIAPIAANDVLRTSEGIDSPNLAATLRTQRYNPKTSPI